MGAFETKHCRIQWVLPFKLSASGHDSTYRVILWEACARHAKVQTLQPPCPAAGDTGSCCIGRSGFQHLRYCPKASMTALIRVKVLLSMYVGIQVS